MALPDGHSLHGSPERTFSPSHPGALTTVREGQPFNPYDEESQYNGPGQPFVQADAGDPAHSAHAPFIPNENSYVSHHDAGSQQLDPNSNDYTSDGSSEDRDNHATWHHNPSFLFPEQAAQRDMHGNALRPTPRNMRPFSASGTQQFQFVGHAEQGVLGLLARHVDVPQSVWDKHMQRLGIKRVLDPLDKRASKSYSHHFEQTALELAAPTSRPWWHQRSIFGLPIIHPQSTFIKFWQAFMLLMDVGFTAFAVPILVAFCTTCYGDLHCNCVRADLFGGIVYTLNMLFSFQSGLVLVHDYRKVVVMRGSLIARYYMLYGRFWLDVIAVVPFVYLIVLLAADVHSRTPDSWINLLSLMRLLRIVRLISISKVVAIDSLSGQNADWLGRYIPVTLLYVVMLGYLLMVMINIQACVMVLIAYLEGLDNSWMTSFSWIDITTQPQAYQWYCAVYYVITTSTTTGYGDVSPKNQAEQVMSNIYMIIGMVMFGLLVGAFSNLFTRASGKASKLYTFRKKKSQVEHWMHHRQLPEAMRRQVQTFYIEEWRNRSELSAEGAILDDLPSSLRAKVAAYITHALLVSVHCFSQLEEEVALLLAQRMRPVDFIAGQDICQQGSDGDRLWIVAEGSVSALHYLQEGVALPTPCLIGESVLFSDEVAGARQRFWTYRATTTCRLWELRLVDVWPLIRFFPQIKVVVLEGVRSQVMKQLMVAKADEGVFCELSAFLSRALLAAAAVGWPPLQMDDLLVEIHEASIEDGTLQRLLAAFIEVCIIKPWSSLKPLSQPAISSTDAGNESADPSHRPQPQQPDQSWHRSQQLQLNADSTQLPRTPTNRPTTSPRWQAATDDLPSPLSPGRAPSTLHAVHQLSTMYKLMQQHEQMQAALHQQPPQQQPPQQQQTQLGFVKRDTNTRALGSLSVPISQLQATEAAADRPLASCSSGLPYVPEDAAANAGAATAAGAFRRSKAVSFAAGLGFGRQNPSQRQLWAVSMPLQRMSTSHPMGPSPFAPWARANSAGGTGGQPPASSTAAAAAAPDAVAAAAAAAAAAAVPVPLQPPAASPGSMLSPAGSMTATAVGFPPTTPTTAPCAVCGHLVCPNCMQLVGPAAAELGASATAPALALAGPGTGDAGTTVSNNANTSNPATGNNSTIAKVPSGSRLSNLILSAGRGGALSRLHANSTKDTSNADAAGMGASTSLQPFPGYVGKGLVHRMLLARTSAILGNNRGAAGQPTMNEQQQPSLGATSLPIQQDFVDYY